MTTGTAQHPINSGFGARTTAAEVLRDIDLSGQMALVTGGYSGIGIETTRALVDAGAHVVVPARRPDAAREALAGIDNVEVDELDLGDLDSVRGFARRFLASGRDIHLTITNAGIMACPLTRIGPGWEAQFGTNHLGHYALVNLLWPAITRGKGRVVALSSAAHRRSPMRWADVQFEHGYDKWLAYGQAKTANALFAVHLDALAKDVGVRAISVMPGGIATPLQRHLSSEEMVAVGLTDEAGNFNERFKTPEQGAATQVWAATSPGLADLGGVYCEDCDVAELVPDDSTARNGVRGYAIDPDQAARLWSLSAELTGIDAFAQN